MVAEVSIHGLLASCPVIRQKTSWQKGVEEEATHVKVIRKQKRAGTRQSFQIVSPLTPFLETTESHFHYPLTNSFKLWPYPWFNPSRLLTVHDPATFQWLHALAMDQAFKPGAFRGAFYVQVVTPFFSLQLRSPFLYMGLRRVLCLRGSCAR